MKKILIALPVFIIIAIAGLYFYANMQTDSQIDLYIERAIASGAYKDIQYDSADIAVDGTITVTGLNVTDAADIQYLINKVEISDMDFLNVFPNSIAISASGFSFPNGLPDLDTSTLPAQWDSLLDTIDTTQNVPVTITYRHQYDPADNNLFSSEISFGLPDSFDFSMDSTTRNIPYETLSQISDPEAAQAAMMAYLMNAEIPELSFSVSDFGLLEALLTNQAMQQGRNVDMIRQEIMSMTQSLFLFVPADLQATAIDLSTELSSFMEGNKTFNLSMHPDFSGSIQQLQVPLMAAFLAGEYGQIVDILNIEFNTN